MKSALPPLNWLRAFEAAARHLSFTGAAGELNMTQSAVSQQIKALESYLNTPLFIRRPRGLALTNVGLTYLPVVRDAFATLSRGTRAVTGGDKNVLRIQSNITFSIHWLAPRLHLFRAAHPDIQLQIETELWETRYMAEGVDLEIRYSLLPDPAVKSELLARDHYYPVCAPDFPVTSDNLQDQPLYDCMNMLGSWQDWVEDQGMVWTAPPVTYATTFSFTLTVAAAGGGMTIAHDLIAGHLMDQGKLIAPFPHRTPMPEAYYLLMTPAAEKNPNAQAFANWLHGQFTHGPE